MSLLKQFLSILIKRRESTIVRTLPWMLPRQRINAAFQKHLCELMPNLLQHRFSTSSSQSAINMRCKI